MRRKTWDFRELFISSLSIAISIASLIIASFAFSDTRNFNKLQIQQNRTRFSFVDLDQEGEEQYIFTVLDNRTSTLCDTFFWVFKNLGEHPAKNINLSVTYVKHPLENVNNIQKNTVVGQRYYIDPNMYIEKDKNISAAYYDCFMLTETRSDPQIQQDYIYWKGTLQYEDAITNIKYSQTLYMKNYLRYKPSENSLHFKSWVPTTEEIKKVFGSAN